MDTLQQAPPPYGIGANPHRDTALKIANRL